MNLAKIYIIDNKYSREDNNFDFKLIIFYDLYNRASISVLTKVSTYPMILKGLALDYYYTNLKNITQDQALLFDQICNTIYNYFERPEYRYSVLVT